MGGISECDLFCHHGTHACISVFAEHPLSPWSPACASALLCDRRGTCACLERQLLGSSECDLFCHHGNLACISVLPSIRFRPGAQHSHQHFSLMSEALMHVWCS